MTNDTAKWIVPFLLVLIPCSLPAQGRSSATQTVAFGVSRPRMQPDRLQRTVSTVREPVNVKILGLWRSANDGRFKVTVCAGPVQCKNVMDGDARVHNATRFRSERPDERAEIDVATIVSPRGPVGDGRTISVVTVTE